MAGRKDATVQQLRKQVEGAGISMPASATKDELTDALARWGGGVATVEGSLSDALGSDELVAPDGYVTREARKGK